MLRKKKKGKVVKNEKKVMEKIQQEAFMQGYQYAIQVLQESIVKSDRVK